MATRTKSISDILMPLEVGEATYIEVANKSEVQSRMRQVNTSSRLKGPLKERSFETSSFTAVPNATVAGDVQFLVRVIRTG